MNEKIIKVLELAKFALYHTAPEDCFVTGPLTEESTWGVIQDYLICPGCEALKEIDILLKELKK